MGSHPKRHWTPYDDGLLYTLWVVHALLTGTADRLQYVNPPFATDYMGGERVYIQSQFQLFEWAAPGDGTYRHDSSFFFATGRGGLTMTAAAAAIRARGNSQRRTRAAHDSVPRWLPADQGSVWVSTHGFWLQTMQGLFPWPWESVLGMQVVQQGTLQMQGSSPNGPVNWQVVTPSAELQFALWVLSRRIPHPQWMSRDWIPLGWIDWARWLGKRLPFESADDLETLRPLQ